MRNRPYVGTLLLLAGVAGAQSAPHAVRLADAGLQGRVENIWGEDEEDYLGVQIYSTTISADGSTTLVGGYGPGPIPGAARAFSRAGGAWTRVGDLPLPPGVPAGSLGDPEVREASVAVSADGGTAIVGLPNASSGAGAAWVFVRSGDGWAVESGLAPTSGVSHLGVSVAISADGSTAVVGAAQFAGYHNGATLVFTRSGGAWMQQGDALVGSLPSRGDQALCVAVSGRGDTVIVGGDGTWVFTRSEGTWSQQGAGLVGTGSDGPAYSVALSSDGNTALVGYAAGDNGKGATLVFTRSAGVWSQQGPALVGTGAVPEGGNGRDGAGQGWAVALSVDGNTAVVGGPADDRDSGAVWVFGRSNGVWAQRGSKLTCQGGPGSLLGEGVAVSANGSIVLAGAPGDGNSGAAWVFSAASTGLWVPAASHGPGVNGSQWRTDLGLLNPGVGTANVQLQYFGPGGAAGSSTTVAAGAQSLLADVVGQLGASGQGALEVLSDTPLKVTARTYSQVAGDASHFANGTLGQGYPAVSASDGLGAGQSAYLAGLVESTAYRTNIGLMCTDAGGAAVVVELYDGAGTKLGEYAVSLAQGQWAQETQPFKGKAGRTAVNRGWAKVTVQSGSGVFAFASVVDNVTNDPTTVVMQR